MSESFVSLLLLCLNFLLADAAEVGRSFSVPFGGNDFGNDDDDGVICVVDISDADIEDDVAGDIDVVFDDFGDDGDDGDEDDDDDDNDDDDDGDYDDDATLKYLCQHHYHC